MIKQLLKYLTMITLITVNSSALAQVDARLRVNLQDLEASNSAIFAEKDTTSVFTALDLSTEVEGIRIATTANWLKRGEETQFNFKISEAFYDFTLDNWYLSAGKKKLDWDVGYGFRPLDMFSPTNSLAIYTSVPPGAVMIVGDYFTDLGNISLICNETRPNYLEKGRQVASSLGCGGRYYRYFTGYEAQLIGHYDNELGFRFGGSALTVIGSNLELHSSFLWQQNYRSPQFHEQAFSYVDNPVVATEWQSTSFQALIGANYSFASGITLITEYWHDGRAPNNTQWQRLIQASYAYPQPHQLIGMRAHFATHNLFRNNFMLHLRTASGNWKPTLTLVTNTDDGSIMFNTELCDSGRTNIQYCFGLRRYLGGSTVIYEQLNYEQIGYLNMEVMF